MKDDKRSLRSIKNDLDNLRQLFGEPIDHKALSVQMHKDLQPYVPGGKHLQQAINFGTHLWEYAFFLDVKEKTTKLASLDELYLNFSKAKQQYPAEFSATYEYYFEAKHRAIANYADNFHLERSKKAVPNTLSVKIAFQEIGQIIEGCIKPFVKYFLRLIELAGGKPSKLSSLAEFDTKTLGDMVTTLRKKSNFSWLYAPEPWGISISQWRNIANHCSYHYDNDTKIITCQYGLASNVKTMDLNYKDIHILYKKINEVFCFLKMADAIFSLGITETTESLTKKHQVTKHGIIATILEVLNINSINVISLDYETSPWNMFAIDPLNRSEDELSEVLSQIARFVLLMDDCELLCTIKEESSGKCRTAIIGKR